MITEDQRTDLISNGFNEDDVEKYVIDKRQDLYGQGFTLKDVAEYEQTLSAEPVSQEKPKVKEKVSLGIESIVGDLDLGGTEEEQGESLEKVKRTTEFLGTWPSYIYASSQQIIGGTLKFMGEIPRPVVGPLGIEFVSPEDRGDDVRLAGPVAPAFVGTGDIAYRDGAKTQKELKEDFVDIGFAKDLSYGVLDTLTVSTASIIAGSILGKNAGVGVFTGSAFFRSFADARERGANFGDATFKGAVDAGVEGWTESWSMGALLKTFPTLKKKLFSFYTKEMPGELTATLLQDFNDKLALEPDKPWGQFFNELIDNLGMTAAVVAVGSPVQVGVARNLNRALGKPSTNIEALAMTFNALVEGTEFKEGAAEQTAIQAFSPENAQFTQQTTTEEGLDLPVFSEQDTDYNPASSPVVPEDISADIEEVGDDQVARVASRLLRAQVANETVEDIVAQVPALAAHEDVLRHAEQNRTLLFNSQAVANTPEFLREFREEKTKERVAGRDADLTNEAEVTEFIADHPLSKFLGNINVDGRLEGGEEQFTITDGLMAGVTRAITRDENGELDPKSFESAIRDVVQSFRDEINELHEQGAVFSRYEQRYILPENIIARLEGKEDGRIDTDTTETGEEVQPSGERDEGTDIDGDIEEPGRAGRDARGRVPVSEAGNIQELAETTSPEDFEDLLRNGRFSVDDLITKEPTNVESALRELTDKWTAQGVNISVFESRGDLKLSTIIVPVDQRKQGIGTVIVSELSAIADSLGKRIILTPGQKDDFHGTTSRSRLVKFYKRLGFVENKNRNKDFTISESMYREPDPLAVADKDVGYAVRPDAGQVEKELGREAVESVSKPRPTLIGNAITKSLVENGSISLVGQKIRSPEDLATLAQVYRNPSFETNRVFYMKDGEVVGMNSFSSRLPGVAAFTVGRADEVGAQVAIGLLEQQMSSLNADSYYLLHNHPSGTVKPSADDIRLTGSLAKDVPGLLAHVIINSNKYSVLDMDAREPKVVASEQHYKEFNVTDELLQPSIPHELLGRPLGRFDQLIAYGKSVQTSEDFFVLIGSGNAGVRGVMEVPKSAVTSPARALAITRNFARQTGAADVFLYTEKFTPEEKEIVFHGIRSGAIRDAVDSTKFSAHEKAQEVGLVKSPGVYYGQQLAATVSDVEDVYAGTPSITREEDTDYQSIHKERLRQSVENGEQVPVDVLTPYRDEPWAAEYILNNSEEPPLPNYDAARELAFNTTEARPADIENYGQLRIEASRLAVIETEKQVEEDRKAIGRTARARAKYDADRNPVLSAMDAAVQAGGLNKQLLDQDYDKATVNALLKKRPGLLSKSPAADPADEFAADNGFDDLDAMITAFIDAPTKKQLTDTLTASYVAEEEAAIAPVWDEFYQEMLIDNEAKVLDRLTFKKKPGFPQKAQRIFAENVSQVKQSELIPQRDNFVNQLRVIERDIRLAFNVSSKIMKTDLKALEQFKLKDIRRKRDEKISELIAKKKEIFERARNRTKAIRERERIKRSLKRMLNSKNLHIDYREQFHNILARYGIKDPRSAPPTDISLPVFVDQLDQEGENVDALRAAVNQLPQKPIGQMTFDDLRTVWDVAKSIHHLGLVKNMTLTGEKKDSIDAQAKAIVEQASGLKRQATTGITFSESAAGKKPIRKMMRRRAAQFFSEGRQAEFILEELDRWEEFGPAWVGIFKPIADAENAELELGGEVFKRIEKAFEPFVGRQWANKIHSFNLENGNIDFSKESMIMIALNAGNEGNRAAVSHGFALAEEGFELTDADINQVVNSLSPEEKKLVREIFATIESLYPTLAETHLNMSGMRLGKVEGDYFPLVWDRALSLRTAEISQKEEAKDLFANIFPQPNLRKGMTVERTGGKLPVKLEFNVITKHLKDTVHFISHGEAVRDSMKLIRHPDVQAIISSKLGTEVYNQLMPWLTYVANPFVPVTSEIERLAGHMRRSFTVAALGYKISVALLQPTSITQTFDRVGFFRTMKHVGSFYTKPWAHAEMVHGKSIMMINRRNQWDRELKALYDKMDPRSMKGGQAVKDSFFYLVGLMDASVTYPSWMAGYEKGIEDFGDEEKAVAFADKMIRTTQPSAGPKDLAQWQRGGEIQKTLYMFYTFFSKLYNNQIRMGRRLSEGLGFLDFLQAVMWVLIVPAVWSGVIRSGKLRRLPTAAELVEEVFLYNVASLPLIRDVIGSFVTGYDYSPTPLAGAGKGLVNLGNELLSEDEIDEIAVAKKAITASGYFVPWPSGQAIVAIDGLLELHGGSDDILAPLIRAPKEPEG